VRNGDMSHLPIRNPMLACCSCSTIYVVNGSARPGLPCAFCDGTIIDLAVEIMKLAETYDPMQWLVP